MLFNHYDHSTFKELLTRLSRAPKQLDTFIRKLGIFGKTIGIIIALFILFGPFIITYLILTTLFPFFINYGDSFLVYLVFIITYFIAYIPFHWFFFSPPQDYVEPEISANIHELRLQLNEYLKEAGYSKQFIHINKKDDYGLKILLINFNSTHLLFVKDESKLKNNILSITRKLNQELERAYQRDLRVVIEILYREPRKEQTTRLLQAQPNHYKILISVNSKINYKSTHNDFSRSSI